MRAFLEAPGGLSVALVDVYAPPKDFEVPRGLPMTWRGAPDGRVAQVHRAGHCARHRGPRSPPPVVPARLMAAARFFVRGRVRACGSAPAPTDITARLASPAMPQPADGRVDVLAVGDADAIEGNHRPLAAVGTARRGWMAWHGIPGSGGGIEAGVREAAPRAVQESWQGGTGDAWVDLRLTEAPHQPRPSPVIGSVWRRPGHRFASHRWGAPEGVSGWFLDGGRHRLPVWLVFPGASSSPRTGSSPTGWPRRRRRTPHR